MSHNRVTEAILFGILFTQLQSCVTAGVNYKCGLGAEWCVCVCVKSACGVWIVCAPHISLSLSSLSLARPRAVRCSDQLYRASHGRQCTNQPRF